MGATIKNQSMAYSANLASTVGMDLSPLQLQRQYQLAPVRNHLLPDSFNRNYFHFLGGGDGGGGGGLLCPGKLFVPGEGVDGFGNGGFCGDVGLGVVVLFFIIS
ncbi:MAG TPA: hypothetical protein VMW01_06435 [Williamwhitmania sp.]|nr:hypothetical protein [Williamwhitmania sp.]